MFELQLKQMKYVTVSLIYFMMPWALQKVSHEAVFPYESVKYVLLFFFVLPDKEPVITNQKHWQPFKCFIRYVAMARL